MSLPCTLDAWKVTVMDGIKFEFIYIISLYTKNESEQKRYVSLGYFILLPITYY